MRPGPDETGVLVGQVLERDSDRPVPGAVVNLVAYLGTDGRPAAVPESEAEAFYSRTVVRRVLTGSEGYFVFRNLSAGRYALTAQAPGHAQPGIGPRIVDVGSQRTPSTVAVRLWRLGSISGHVFDERGDPVVGAPVAILERMMGGGSVALRPRLSEAYTDDRGVYRIVGVPHGRYVVGVVSSSTTIPAAMAARLDDPTAGRSLLQELENSGRLSLRTGEGTRIDGLVLQRSGQPPVLDSDGRPLTPPTTFYPSVTSGADAQVVTLSSGEDRNGIDISITYTRTFRVAGTVTGPEGSVPNLVLRLLPPDSAAVLAADAVPSMTAVTDVDGTFAFLGVSPGSYVLSAVRFPRRTAGVEADSDTMWFQQPIAVGDADVSNVAVTMLRGFRVSGRVVFQDADASVPPQGQFITILLRPFGAGAGRNRAASTRVAADGTFTTVGHPPGRYQVALSVGCSRPGSCPTPWRWQESTLGGETLPDDVVEIDAADRSGLVLSLSKQGTRLWGSVADSSEHPDSTAAVVAFPADTELWRDDALGRRVRSVLTTYAGEFEIRDLPPGSYYLVAVDASYPYGDPGALERLVASSTRVSLGRGGERQVRLKTATQRW